MIRAAALAAAAASGDAMNGAADLTIFPGAGNGSRAPAREDPALDDGLLAHPLPQDE
jgi:hypothetical protein